MPKLEPLFNPKSVAIVGVSVDPNKIGSVILRNMIDAGFAGDLLPINPKYTNVFGHECYPSLAQTGKQIDLAVISVPADKVLGVMQDAAQAKVKFAVIITAGFRETGAAGGDLEQQVLRIARSAGIRLLGPNCLGISVPGSSVNASFAATQALPGNVAFVSQSGAFNTALLDLALERNLGFSHFVSIGNKLDLSELDFLEDFYADPQVKVIGMYLEEFSDGNDLVSMIAQHPEKKVVILHPGESEQSKSAISSHTGSLAGSSRVIKTALRQAGAIQVETFEELFNVLWILEAGFKVTQNTVAVVTNAGGPGIMLTDMLVKAGIQVPKLSEQTQSELKQVLPPTASTHNPVDLVGDALAERYASAIDILEKDQSIGTIVVLVTPQLVTQVEDTAKLVYQHMIEGEKQIVPLFMGGEFVEPAIKRISSYNQPVFQYPEQLVSALGKLLDSKTPSVPNLILPIQGKYLAEVDAQTTTELKPLSQGLVYQMATEAGIDLPRQKLISTMDELMGFVGEVHYPVVLKARAEDILHKTDAKALYLNIHDVEELHAAFSELSTTLTNQNPGKPVQMIAQEQIGTGEELLIGVKRDGRKDVYLPTGRGFGHLILFGKGGIYTEIYKDLASVLVPATTRELTQLIAEPKVGQIIAGARGKAPLAQDKLIFLLESIQKLVLRYPQIAEIDINPAIITTDRCVAVDIKFLTQL